MKNPKIPYKIGDQNAVYFVTFTVVQWVYVFSRPKYIEILLASLEYCQKEKGLIVYAWCLMSNHIHLVARAEWGAELSDILRDLKKHTSKEIIQEIREEAGESRRDWMLWIFESAGKKNSNNAQIQFWKQSNLPKELFWPKFIKQKLDYVHNNPVKVGLVDKPEHYRYSSARDYSGEQGLLDMEVTRNFA